MIQTVCGPIKVENVGNVLVHEHIGCISNDLMHTFGQDWLDKEKLAEFAAGILKLINEMYGVGLIVDGTPIDLGRDISLIKEVSKRSNVPIVASAGLYHYPSLYTSGHSPLEIASWFIREFERGMEGTSAKPGMLKTASDSCGITEENKKRLTAMSIVQKETNMPIYVHSAHNSDLAERQLEILLENIKEPEKIIIGHTSLRADAEYLEKFLDKGCFICMDQCHCTSYSVDSIGKTLALLCRKGYTNKILLSNDMCIYTDFGTRNITGFHLTQSQQAEKFGYIFREVYGSFLDEGGNEKDWDVMIKKNPLKILDI